MSFLDYFKDRDKNKYNPTKLFYIFILFYFSLLFYIALKDKNLFFIILFVIFILFLLSILICDIFYYYNKFNLISIKLKNLYQLIILKIESFKKNKPSIEERRLAVKRFFYLFFFLFLPMFFIISIISFNGSEINHFIMASSQKTDMYTNYYEITSGGILYFNYTFKQDFRIKLSYLMGKELNLPLLDLCFLIKEKDLPKQTNLSSFTSNLYILNDTYKINVNKNLCIPINLEPTSLNYEWKTQYEYFDENIDFNNLTKQMNNHFSIKFDTNFWLVSLIIYIAWVGVLHLIYRVFKDFLDIK